MGVTGEPTVAYLGWHGLGNLGDDAIYDAVGANCVAPPFSICRASHTS